MNDETIFSTLPEISEETKRRVALQFDHYIWYHGNGSRDRREFHCSVCGKSWAHDDLRTVTDDDWALRCADHGEEVTCPHCGESAKLMCLGKCRSGWRYSQAFGISIVAAAEGNPDEVWIRTYRVYRDYGSYYSRGSGIWYNAGIRWNEVSRHRLVPWKADYWSKGFYSTELAHHKRLYDFFNNKNWHDVVSGDCWTGIIFQTPLADTFLRYCAWDEYARKYSTCPTLYLCTYAEHPQIEMMVKLGYSNVVQELVMERKKNVRSVNWDATRPHETFRLSKADYAEWQRRGGDFRMRKIFGSYKGHGARWAATQEEYDATEKHTFLADIRLKQMVRAAGKDFHSFLMWFNKQAANTPVYGGSGAYYKWRDYIALAKECGCDLKHPKVLMPDDVFRAHDDMLELSAMIRAEEDRKKAEKEESDFEKQLPKYRKKYTASDGVYMIRVPEKTAEIVREGSVLGHCVGRMNYIKNMAEGKNAIVFLRKCAEPDKPWYTLEVSPNKVVQCEGAKRNDGKAGYFGHLYRNDLPDDAKAFLDAWEAKVCKTTKTTEKKETA